jgi:hypothetical protein
MTYSLVRRRDGIASKTKIFYLRSIHLRRLPHITIGITIFKNNDLLYGSIL